MIVTIVFVSTQYPSLTASISDAASVRTRCADRQHGALAGVVDHLGGRQIKRQCRGDQAVAPCPEHTHAGRRLMLHGAVTTTTPGRASQGNTAM